MTRNAVSLVGNMTAECEKDGDLIKTTHEVVKISSLLEITDESVELPESFLRYGHTQFCLGQVDLTLVP